MAEAVRLEQVQVHGPRYRQIGLLAQVQPLVLAPDPVSSACVLEHKHSLPRR
jgi:hypothetical protein